MFIQTADKRIRLKIRISVVVHKACCSFQVGLHLCVHLRYRVTALVEGQPSRNTLVAGTTEEAVVLAVETNEVEMCQGPHGRGCAYQSVALGTAYFQVDGGDGSVPIRFKSFR